MNHNDSSEYILKEIFAHAMKTEHRLIWANFNIHALSQLFVE